MRIGILIFRTHALLRMSQRGIAPQDVREALEQGEVIEDYPDDRPYPSCLVLGRCGSRSLHIVIADNREDGETVVITVYEPDNGKWHPDFRRRKP
uniref:DUF4258 domain-containing protein n=1 Tax=Geobacter metallireducens TaxID=28232 RepID=A0A831U4S1_GEOME